MLKQTLSMHLKFVSNFNPEHMPKKAQSIKVGIFSPQLALVLLDD